MASRSVWPLRLLLSLLCCLPFTQARAQHLLHAVTGPFQGARFGADVGMTGDLDGDGLAEWMAGRRGKSDTEKKPELRVFSGVGGKRLYVLPGFGSINGLFLESLGDVGDVNGDGVHDFAFGNSNAKVGLMTNAGKLAVFSGQTGKKLYVTAGPKFNGAFGASMAPLGDVTGDGVSDLVVGQLGSLDENAWVMDGADGDLLYNVKGPGGGDWEFGYDVAATGDLDGDGVPDFAVGTLSAALVQVFSGGDGHLLRNITGAPGFGMQLDDLGDVNGDGVHDLLASEESTASALILSGRDGSLLGSVTDDQGVEFGVSLAAVGDMDGDGVAEFAVGDAGFDAERGRVSVFSGATRLRLFVLQGAQAGERFGASVAGGRDVDGDGLPDLVVGAPLHHAQGRKLGQASVWSGRGP